MKHLILVQQDESGFISKTQYFKTSFSRELGETITYDGKSFKVGIMADDKDTAINAINTIIKKQNKAIRQMNRKATVQDIELTKMIREYFSTTWEILN